MRKFLQKIPLKLSLVVIPLCLVVKEWFPLSHFPMYARPSQATYFVYLTDGDGTVLPIREQFGIFAAALKKVHKHHLKLAHTSNPVSAAACRKTLEYAIDYREHRVHSDIKLQQVQLFVSIVRLSGHKITLSKHACARKSVYEA